MTSEEKAQKARDILNSNPQEEDLKIAVGLVNEAVADNNATATNVLAQMHYRGTGVEKDDKKAFELCMKSVEGGCERAKLLLAQLYAKGAGVEKDLPKARKCLEDLMAKDDSVAYYDMGCYVLECTFPEIDEYEGIAYLEKASSMGHEFAMARLGQAYASLCETEEAEYWFSKAEAAGVEGIDLERERFKDEAVYDQQFQQAVNFYFSRGKYDKAFRLLERDTAAGKRTARFLLAFHSIAGVGEEAYGRDIHRAISIYSGMSAEGEAHANFMLGYIYNNIEEARDPDKGKAFLLKAAEAGHPDAQYNLAFIYCADEAGDKAEGMKWMEAAAGQGQGDALYLLASCHLQDAEIGAADWQHNPGYEQDTEKGMDYLKRAAEQDSFAALASLAQCCRNGKYMAQDDNKAFEYMQRSCAIKQHPEHLDILADFYREGIGTPQDYEAAARLYQLAAAMGNVPAMGKLSILYHEGKGVEKDEEKAEELLRQYNEQAQWLFHGKLPLHEIQRIVNSAENGSDEEDCSPGSLTDAMNQLGDRYANGDEVEQDEEKAVEWWEKAVQRGSAMAMHSLGVYHARNGNMPKALEYMERSAAAGYLPALYMTGSYHVQNGESDDEKEKGIAYLTAAGEGGDTDALHFLTCMYHDGMFAEKDYNKARYWLGKYVATGAPLAYLYLGQSLYFGDMFEQDRDKALENVRAAVKGGCQEATELYMSMRWQGNKCERDRGEVVAVYSELAENGDDNAMHQLYLLYSDEDFDGRDTETAMKWLKKSAERNNADALWKLAWAYVNGIDVEKDVEKAMPLLDKAIELGNENAVYCKTLLLVYGEEGVLQPDYDKAMEVIRPYTEDDAKACYLFALACDGKCSGKNAYSWELAAEAAQKMEKAAELGYDEAMETIGKWYGQGRGVLADFDKAKGWLQKYAEYADETEETSKTLNLSDDDLHNSMCDARIYYWQEIVEHNKEKITDWQEYIDEENYVLRNLAINAAQLGEVNAAFSVGDMGMDLLKTDPDEAKRLITFSEQAANYYAEKAGKTLLEDNPDDEEAVSRVVDYFVMGANQGSVGCYLQLGLLFTTEGAGKEAEQAGAEYLRQICELEGDDWEEERQQAKARLEEIESRPKSLVGKLIRRMRK